MSRKDSDELIADIFADSGADLDELTRLRGRLDDLRDEISDQEVPDIVVTTSKSFDVTRLLVEQGIYKSRLRSHEPVDHAKLKSIVAANVAYLQATVNALPDQAQPQ
ncbi:MAG: hypothetical protein M3400_05185 [Actinomycetota bacterium]|nr:hypothetical protein [Actinomycetota bacterium]